MNYLNNNLYLQVGLSEVQTRKQWIQECEEQGHHIEANMTAEEYFDFSVKEGDLLKTDESYLIEAVIENLIYYPDFSETLKESILSRAENLFPALEFDDDDFFNKVINKMSENENATLRDYNTDDYLRRATREEVIESLQAKNGCIKVNDYAETVYVDFNYDSGYIN